jgi:hypothetical protein
MNKYNLQIPIIFLVFNRPDTTKKVFEVIRQVKPPQLLVVADGARNNKPGEAEKCAHVKKIIDTVDWDCQVLTNYSDRNLGCNKRVSSGLNWAFSLVDKAIIIEDDCLPTLSFFPFCEELLEKYQDDRRIMTISGDNFQFGRRRRTNDSYYFSIYNHCWGWATWRRAWEQYDIDMKLCPKIVNDNWLKDILINPYAVKYWQNKFQTTYENKIDSWAFRWTFACWVQSGLTILPNVNLVSNIGFNSAGTHLNNSNSIFADIPTQEIKFPLQHPSFVIRNKEADDFTYQIMFSLFGRTKRKAREFLKI